MSALRERLRALIEAHVGAVAPDALRDLWERARVSVVIEDLVIAPAAGRKEHAFLSCTGTATARVIADHPEELPDERLWARLAVGHTLPTVVGYLRAPRVALTRVRESIGGSWCEQSLTFEFTADFVGVEIS